MRSTLKALCLLLALLMVLPLALSLGARAYADDGGDDDDFTETEQPELDEETKRLIAVYHRFPTEANYLALRAKVCENYNAVLARKEAKLQQLIEETAGKPGGEEIVAEMREIVQEMYITYWNRINSNMLRFTDNRFFQWHIADAPNYEYIPVMGAGDSIYVKRTPVTNAEYAVYLAETGADAPQNWTDGEYPEGEDDFPVNYVSISDAQAYCAWLTECDGVNTYRLPNESEWELAAGHMPKDAAFNCGVTDGRVSVFEYDGITRGAHGAIDLWGNVWEWTSTVRSEAEGVTRLGVKGGSWKSQRTECRTEHRKEDRNAEACYDDVGFRVIQVINGEEPEQSVELATLKAPVTAIQAVAHDSLLLSWQTVAEAVNYQIYEYDEQNDLVAMLALVEGNSILLTGLDSLCTHSYIVQPVSYVSIGDNVEGKYSIKASCAVSTEKNLITPLPEYDRENGVLTLTWEAVPGVRTYFVYRCYMAGGRPLLKGPYFADGSSWSARISAESTCRFVVTSRPLLGNYNSENYVTVKIP